MDAVLDVSGLRVIRSGKEVVKGVSFHVRRGEVFGILGGNGSGKSTTVKAILGLIPYGGSVVWHVPLTSVSYVPQHPALYRDFTLRENIQIFSRIAGSAVSNPTHLLEYFGLEQYLDVEIRAMSGGYQKLSNLLISLLSNPSVLVLDEPTAEIDFDARQRIIQFLKVYARAGNTVIIVTHVPGEADELCDRILVMHRGSAKMVGDPRQILSTADIPYLVRIYGIDSGAVDTHAFKYCRVRRITDDFVELEIPESLASKGLREAFDFADSVGADRVYVDSPDVIRAVEQMGDE